jgi:hypothetical protein
LMPSFPWRREYRGRVCVSHWEEGRLFWGQL